MPNTVKVPGLGQVPKGSVIAGGLAAVAVGGYVYWKHITKQSATASTTATDSTYGYGQYGYGQYGQGQYGYGQYGTAGFTPYPVGEAYGYGAYGYGLYNPYTGAYIGGSTSTGGTGTTTTATTPQTVPEWLTAADSALSGHYSALQLDAALGKYLSGLALTTDQYNIVTQAIGAVGPAPGNVPAPHVVPSSGQPKPKPKPAGKHVISAPGNMTLLKIAEANGISELQLITWNPGLRKKYYGSGKPIPKGTRVTV
jgi:LysM repeat protein